MSLKVGFGRVDITPEDSVPLAGLGNTLSRMSDNVLDRLLTTCLAFSDEQNTVLVYTSDLIRSMEELQNGVREKLTEKYGIPGENIMFCQTHTHSATDYMQQEHPAVQAAAQMLVTRLQEAAELAMADRKPARLFTGSANPRQLNFVRHYSRDPETRELTGHLYEPDNQLQLVKIAREGARDILMANWQAHPCFTSGYNKHDISADYIHTLRRFVEGERDMLFAFFLGASGDVNARSRIKSEVLAPDYETYAQLMKPYFQQALENMTAVEEGPVRAGRTGVTLVYDHKDDHMVEDAKLVQAYWKRTYDRKATDAMAQVLGINSPYHANAIVGRAQRGDHTQIEIRAVTVGGLGFAFAPYEMFCRNGMFIKEQSPQQVTLVCTCSNGANSYFADDFAFTAQCYEVDVRKYERGTAEKVASAFVSLLEQLK